MRALGGALLCSALIFAYTEPALASACDSFNLMKFSPNELEQCIIDIKFSELMEHKTQDVEIKVLKLQVCNLALALSQLKPMDKDDLESFCPDVLNSKRQTPKKSSQ